MRDRLRLLCVSAEEADLFRQAAAARHASGARSHWIRSVNAEAKRHPLAAVDPRAKTRYVLRPERVAFCVSESEQLEAERAAMRLRATWSVWQRSVLLRDCAALGLAPADAPPREPDPPPRRDRVHKTVRFHVTEIAAQDLAWRAEGFASWAQWILRVALDEAADPLLAPFQGQPAGSVVAPSMSRQIAFTLSQWTRCEAGWRAAKYPSFSSWLRDAAHKALVLAE